MAVRSASAVWEGSLREGSGKTKGESGAFDVPFSFSTRFEEAPGTNPEELIGAAHAGCFSMALSANLGRAGFNPTRIETVAKVHLERGDSGFGITRIVLTTEAEVPGIDEAAFQEQVQTTKSTCPVSKALASVPLEVEAKLVAG